MNAAAIDIGTNSMRLLIVDKGGAEVVRDGEVTGLGTGVDATGRFDPERVAVTLEVMDRFGQLIRLNDVTATMAVATSATRDAENGPDFAEAVAARIGVMPEIISGEREAGLAFAGATHGRADERYVIIDIGGGSTEFIAGTGIPETATSIDIGSVRLTDRILVDRPAPASQVLEARDVVDSLIGRPVTAAGSPVIGVAGTFTSMAAIAHGLVEYDRSVVHGLRMSVSQIDALVDELASLTVEQTAAIPSLNPSRAPVILAGAVIAARALRAVGADEVTVSEYDLLDALASEARISLD